MDTIVDSRRAVLVWEPGKKVPIYAFPREDVRPGTAPAAIFPARGFADPDLDGYITIPWDSLDHWFEEDEEVFVHPRDPLVRIDALKSSRHVRVERDGQLLAESDSPVPVFETGLPTRYYLPERDVDPSLLADSDLQTGCPYKGFASYRDVLLNGHRHPGLFWYYQAPFREVSEIKGYLAPYNERVDLIVDGHPQERPAGPLGPRAEPNPAAASRRAASSVHRSAGSARPNRLNTLSFLMMTAGPGTARRRPCPGHQSPRAWPAAVPGHTGAARRSSGSGSRRPAAAPPGSASD